MTDGVRSVRVQLMPWRLRWRSKDIDVAGADAWPDSPGAPDDLLGALGFVVVVLLLVVVLPFVVLAVVGLFMVAVEIAALAVVVPLLFAGRLAGLRPWRLVVTDVDGDHRLEEVTGTRAMLARRRALRALRAAA